MNRYLTVFFLFFMLSLGSFAQQSAVYTSDDVTFKKAVALYNAGQYLAAQPLFQRIGREAEDEGLKGECAYFAANCAVRLNQQGADAMMEAFVADYPTSVRRNSAYIDVAEYYFENGKYSYARKWYDKVDDSRLNRADLERFYFNNGYAYFKSKNWEEAKTYLNRVADSKNYGSQAKYYLGFIAYENDSYEEANDYFDQVGDNPAYNEELSYYQADMNFKLGNFQKAIDLGLEQYDSAAPRERSELAKIIGESYFNLEKYAEAIPYLKEFKGRRGKWNNTDYYQLGYAYYKQEQYAEAIAEFNKIVDGRNSVAQNAFYHLAESYLKLDKKQEALNAFKNASEMDFSAEIRQDAWLNYAKLSYEIGNPYTSVPQVLASYMDAYPESEANAELQALLIDSYITSKNYEEALNLLERENDAASKAAYQKVAFYRAVELILDSEYASAEEYLDKSLIHKLDPSFTARATYWKAQCDYELSNYAEALVGYRQFAQLGGSSNTPEWQDFKYHKAYVHFKLKEYNEAITDFTSFSGATSNLDLKNDALLRLGDSYFVTSKYWPAMEHYNMAIEGGVPSTDYAEFQKAISYGFVDRNPQKIEGLKNFASKYPRSAYKDDALYELGNTYVSIDNIPEAMRTYDQLVQQVPQSSYVPRAMLKKALLLDNDNRSDEALSIFRDVVANYPGTPEALQAVSSAKLIYIDQGRVDEYGAWVSSLDFVEVADSELDDATYKAAEQSFLANNKRQAISRFKKYVEDFPNGRHALQANFYLGQLYYGEQAYAETIPHYTYVVEQPRSEYTEQALSRLSQVYLEQQDYAQAIGLLEELEQVADFPENIIFAQSNIMKSSYELKRYEQAVTYADKVLANPKIDTKVKSDAQIIIARAAWQTGDRVKAKAAYNEVNKIASGALKAESLYYKAYFQNADGEYAASNATVQNLAKDYSGYKELGAKGLVVMAKNFFALDDAYQATYILESVISNFADFPEVVTEAEQELATIKAAQAKTNASVETGGSN
ncbi:tetratricopeptide repeat protein [Gilvibacter sp.]|uniref:tetratricopeptide repeat protein n=1 Tax=Gilvibacter sp. TaxID=2729997 RepID=UPI0035BE309A